MGVGVRVPAAEENTIEYDVHLVYGTHYIPPPVMKRGPDWMAVRKRVAVDMHTKELIFDANYGDHGIVHPLMIHGGGGNALPEAPAHGLVLRVRHRSP